MNGMIIILLFFAIVYHCTLSQRNSYGFVWQYAVSRNSKSIGSSSCFPFWWPFRYDIPHFQTPYSAAHSGWWPRRRFRTKESVVFGFKHMGFNGPTWLFLFQRKWDISGSDLCNFHDQERRGHEHIFPVPWRVVSSTVGFPTEQSSKLTKIDTVLYPTFWLRTDPSISFQAF